MLDAAYLPLTNRKEVATLADELPIAVDQKLFQEFILGFPRSYLSNTPRLEIVKHYLLMKSLDSQNSITSLYAADEGLCKLVLATRDRQALFAVVSGAVSSFGMNIRSAQAFANRASLALGTFLFEDPEHLFHDLSEKETFQANLESFLEGELSCDERFIEHWNESEAIPSPVLKTDVNNRTHPLATHVRFAGPDHFGLLFCLSRFLANQNCAIHLASIRTVENQAWDDFYLTHEGSKLPDDKAFALARELEVLISRLLSREIGIQEVFNSHALTEQA